MNKISIITSVFNGEKTIETCLKSVSQQTIDVEHIIIDAESTDQTLEIVKQFKHVSQVISEKDKGIYDGLNKGLKIATGDIIGFLHADDFYTNSNVMENLFSVFSKTGADSCYGDLVYVDSKENEKIVRHWKAGEFNYKKFYQGWMPPHPSFFVKKRIYEKYGGFRVDLGTAGDYELMLRLLVKHRISSVYLPEIITKMRTGGLSNVTIINRIKANINDRKAWKLNGLRPYPWTLFFKPLSKVIQFLNN